MRQWARIRRRGWLGFRPRLQHWLLLIAILPSWTFLGHFHVAIDIPFTNQYLVLVPAAPHDDSASANVQTHENHCHANASTCTDIPFTGASPFLLARQSVAYFGAAAVFVAISLSWWRPTALNNVGPDLQPPKHSASRKPAIFA